MNLFKTARKHNNHEHNPIKHIFHMVLCCGLPLLIIALLPLIAGLSPAVAGFLGIITPFICPIMMGGMMLMMLRGNKRSCCGKTNEPNELSQNDSYENELPK